MARLEMPPPLPIDWQMKDVSTAETHFGDLDDGRLELRIKHDLIRGVTPIMLVWWFQHNIEEVGNFEFFLPGHYAEHQEAA